MTKKFIAIALSVPALAACIGAGMSIDDLTGPSQPPIPPWYNAENIPAAFMEHEDTNGDGQVTQDEFKGPDNEFTIFDLNNDGLIVLAEAPTKDRLPKLNVAPSMAPNVTLMDEVTINGVHFDLEDDYAFFGWDELPGNFRAERNSVQEFTSPDGTKHYYQLVYLPDGNLNWFQAAYLADSAGGYLASITSEEENSFIFNLVNDMKYFWKFPKYEPGKSQHNHYEITIGPFLGGYQPEGSEEPAGGWRWLSGEKWEYSNWAVNLDDGLIDKDPRPNDQPNDSGDGQRIMGFGEMNLPVPTWGDYMDNVGTYGSNKLPGRSYAFIIEFEQNPE